MRGGLALGAMASLPKFSMAAPAASNGGRVRVACVGCGGRGTGALRDMLNADKNVQIVALGDLFEDRLKGCDSNIRGFANELRSKDAGVPEDIYAVTPETMFCGWDACDKVLQTGCDAVILAAPPCFRAEHLEKALGAGKHVFAEKPMFVDAVQARKVFGLAELADKNGLTVVTGYQRRYDPGYQEAVKRIHDGEIGEIVAAQCYWMQGGYVGGAGWGDRFALDTIGYQIRNWPSWIWSSGDHIVEQHCHNLDVVNWCFDDRKPDSVFGQGGRGVAQEGKNALPYPQFGDRYSNFTVDFDYGGDVHMTSMCRQEPGTLGNVGERVVGTKGIMVFYGPPRILSGGRELWKYSGPRPSPYVREHEFLLKSIRGDVPRINQITSSANSNMLALAGRESAYSGKQFKFDWVIAKSQQSLVPETWDLEAKKPVGRVPVAGVYELV